jgi:hypothetical protein
LIAIAGSELNVEATQTDPDFLRWVQVMVERQRGAGFSQGVAASKSLRRRHAAFARWILVACMLVGAARVNGQEIRPTPLASWGAGLGIDERVLGEMGRFDDGGTLSDGYPSAFARQMRSEVFVAAERALGALASHGCEPMITVDLPVPRGNVPADPRSPVAERFEQSLIRVESVTCISTERDDPAAALTLFTSPEFRRAAESRIEEIRVEGGKSCERTGGTFPLLAPTSSCASLARLDADGFSALHSQVIANPDAARTQLVYFKESLKTVVRIPGGIAIHHVHYSRSVNLGRLERWVASGKVRGAEENTLALLKERILASAP